MTKLQGQACQPGLCLTNATTLHSTTCTNKAQSCCKHFFLLNGTPIFTTRIFAQYHFWYGTVLISHKILLHCKEKKNTQPNDLLIQILGSCGWHWLLESATMTLVCSDITSRFINKTRPVCYPNSIQVLFLILCFSLSDFAAFLERLMKN